MNRLRVLARILALSCPAFVISSMMGMPTYAMDMEKHVIKRGEPALLIAKSVHYDEKNAVVTAEGNVEIVQGETILRADRVIYNLNKDNVVAVGHVSILEPTGDVFFADHADLTTKMQQGVVQNFQARLKDNSLFAARQGHKISKDMTKLDRLVYSPCTVCKPAEGEPYRAPLWQIEARKATVDEEAKRVSYRDAFLDVYGMPVMYTPYFSHATPDAPSESGILTPQYFHSSDLGNVVKVPLYASFAPNMDMILTPWYLSDEKPLLAGEFRTMFKNGSLLLNGAYTDTYNRDSNGNLIPGMQSRGYIEAHGRYRLSDVWSTGLDAERTTDDTFLQRYRFGWKDVLTSKLYAERIENRNYADIETITFQGLTTQDDGRLSPNILPKANFHYESDPGYLHSRTTWDSSLLVTDRDEGVSTRRISSTAGWKIPYITHNGQVFEANTTLRADGYDVSDQLTDANTHSQYSGTLGRVIPQLDLNWRYPFVNSLGDGRSLMLAPVVEYTVSPNLHLSSKFPNEDSQVTELSDINLFSPNRYTGIDQFESGSRFTYGTRGHLQQADDQWIEWLLGQAYQENDENTFPITSSTKQHFSDYIGRLGIKYRWFDIAYSFRMDRDKLTPTSNNVNTQFRMDPVNFEVSYVSLRDDPSFGNRQEVFGNTTWDMTPNWKLGFSGRRDLGSNDTTIVNSGGTLAPINPLEQPSAGTVGLGSTLTFHNECLMVTGSVSRSYINQQDVRPSTTFGIMLTLNNFGGKQHSTSNLSGPGNVEAVTTTTPILKDPPPTPLSIDQTSPDEDKRSTP